MSLQQTYFSTLPIPSRQLNQLAFTRFVQNYLILDTSNRKKHTNRFGGVLYALVFMHLQES